MRRPLLALLGITAMAATAAAQDIGGTYAVEGTNFDGSPYRGQAQITFSGDTTCTIEWKTGSTSSQGICMRDGGTLAAAYSMDKVVGLVVYRTERDGTLRGVWTIAGQNGSGAEILTPQ